MHKGNHLINESSPYLLQHAYNPVDWYPWGNEALDKARENDLPILVSIGYSACHWCHVMERESFEDAETAALMNKHFVNIKIDREERPDLDQVYMEAVQLIAGNGGWPLNVFLTPAAKPFYGGTYFPPVKAFNRSSWKDVLSAVHDLYTNKRQEVEAQASDLVAHIGNINIKSKVAESLISGYDLPFLEEDAEIICKNLLMQADNVCGGFGSAPKFPQTFCINYLLRYSHFTKSEQALKVAALSLDKMIYGGIYDQLGGGFARYSTDKEWLAPHFEKMLYDNALLISTTVDAFLTTGYPHYKITVDETIGFVQRELMSDENGFFAALDADSEGEEGKFYVWQYDEIQNILGDNAALFCKYYDISAEGNWEHKNILRVMRPIKEFVLENNLDEYRFEQNLLLCKQQLLSERNKRIRPGTDDKIILGWNALMNIAIAKAAAAFGNDDYKALAIKNFDFLWQKFQTGSSSLLFHTYKNGTARHPAFLDDYAFLIKACIHLQELTSDQAYLEKAFELTKLVNEHFITDDSSGYFYTGKMQQDIIVRKSDSYDGALPSGNSIMMENLVYLSVVFNKSEWREIALHSLNNILNLVKKYPSSFANWACIIIDQVHKLNEIAIVGTNYKAVRKELLQYFIPNKILQCSEFNEFRYPLLTDKNLIGEDTLIYLCKNYACEAPVSSTEKLLKKINGQLIFDHELQ